MKRIDLPLSAEELTDLYVEQKLTDKEIATLKGFTEKQVRRHSEPVLVFAKV